MRIFVVAIALAALVLPARALASPPVVSVNASKVRGAAPLDVTLTAAGDAASYHWELGDGATADGAVVQHVYANGGSYTATVTATSASGETAQARVSLAALAVSLRAPARAQYGKRAVLRGRIQPAEAGRLVVVRQGERTVGSARSRRGGTFRLRPRVLAPDPLQAVFEDAVSGPEPLAVRPVLRASFDGSRTVGSRLVLTASVRPARAGALLVRVFRGGRERVRRTFEGRVQLRLDTRRARPLVIRLESLPANGFARARRRLQTLVTVPTLSIGSHGPSVRELEQRLRELHYALPGVDGYFNLQTFEAVLAFQKVNGLPWTGRVTPHVWTRLQSAGIPRPRYTGTTHLEVDKGRQVLFDVIHGQVARAIHISTGATGNTPLGVWHVYSKVPGFNAISMYFSMFFVRGFAIHGYPSVPAYPASHGCVRTPLWIAPTLYAEHGYGTTVFIY
jgi:hypothetical protein